MADTNQQAALDKANARATALESMLALARGALEAATRDLDEHDADYHHKTRAATKTLIAESLTEIDKLTRRKSTREGA